MPPVVAPVLNTMPIPQAIITPPANAAKSGSSVKALYPDKRLVKTEDMTTA